jgi:AcrR family transcriptional regulator
MDDSRDKIIHEAYLLISAYGFVKFTMDELARHMGMSKKTLYRLFDSKYDLISQVIEYIVENDRKIMLREFTAAKTFQDKFKSLCFFHYENHIYKVHLIELETTHPELLARLREIVQSRENEFRAFFGEAKKARAVRSDVDEDVVFFTLRAAIGFVLDARSIEMLPLQGNQFLQSISDILWRGIRAEET